jgi:hypothetical protein
VSDSTCVTNCYNAHPNGQALYYSLAACDNYGECGVCSQTCPQPSQCLGAADSGAPDSGSGVDAAQGVDAAPPPSDAGTQQDSAPACTTASTACCGSCTDSSCATQKAACATGTPCDQYTQCVAGCAVADAGGCIDDCGTTFAQGKSDSAALSTCVQTNCGTQCS